MIANMPSRFVCPRCGELELRYRMFDGNHGHRVDTTKYICGGCGDTWNARDIRKLNDVDGLLCELCGERQAEIEFNQKLQLPADEAGLPVGWSFVRGLICFECFDASVSDDDLARQIEQKQLERLALLRKGRENETAKSG